MTEVYNRLTVMEVLPVSESIKGKRQCKATCICGNTKQYDYGAIKSGNTKSCGCLKKERDQVIGYSNKTHGESGKDYYGCYIRMVDRCTNPNSGRYSDYGGRGITVCKEWLESPLNFIKDMGDRPSKKHTIERINNEDGYYKENCKWATYKEQNQNKRKYKNNSKYGTGIYKKKNRYLSYVGSIYLGSFLTVGAATRAREEYIKCNQS